MRIPWAIQGPGPVTLAYRASLSLRHQHTAQNRRPASTEKSVQSKRPAFGLRRDVPAQMPSTSAPTAPLEAGGPDRSQHPKRPVNDVPRRKLKAGGAQNRDDSQATLTGSHSAAAKARPKGPPSKAKADVIRQDKPSPISKVRNSQAGSSPGEKAEAPALGKKSGGRKVDKVAKVDGKEVKDAPSDDPTSVTVPKEKQKTAGGKQKGPVEPIVFNFADTREDRLPGKGDLPVSRQGDGQSNQESASARTDLTSKPSTLSAGRVVDDSGNLIGVDESPRKRASRPLPSRIIQQVDPATHEQDLYQNQLPSVPRPPAYASTAPPIPYTRTSRSTLDRLDLSERHRKLLRMRHHDQAVPTDEYMPVFAAAPPGHRHFEPHLAGFRGAVQTEHLLQLIESYGKLGDWRSVDQFNAADWVGASRLIALSIRSEYAAMNVGRMLREQPVVYGGLADMALESAVRDHWEGLYRLMLALVRVGEPKRVIMLYERYRQRLLQHQGRSGADLHDWNRATRLAARVEGEGIKPISTVHLAALIMLDDVNGTTIARIFGSRTNWRTFDQETVQEVVSVLRRVRRSDTESLVSGFQTALSQFLLAILCHHPNALRERIKELYVSNSWSLFEGLWNQILAGSIGPKRIIRPLDLASSGKSVTDADVVLTEGVWNSFIDGFSHFGRPQELWHIVNEILPARELVISPSMFGRVGLALARTAMNVTLSEVTRRVAKEYGALLHRRAVAMGYARVDAYLGPRLEVDYIMQRFGELDAAYDQLRAQGVNIGPETRVALVHAFASRDPSRALQVLGWTLGDPKIADPTSPYPYKRFVASLAKAWPNFPYHRIVKVLRDRPKGCEIPSETRALVATMMVHQNSDIKLDDYVRALIDCAGVTVDHRARVVSVVVTRGSNAHSTTEIEASAALELLRDYITHRAHLQIQSRVERIWVLYLRSVIRSRALKTERRRLFVRQAVSLLEDKYGSVRPVTLYNIAEWTLSRRHLRARPSQAELDDKWDDFAADRRDAVASDEDTAEAVYWWGRLRGIDTEQPGSVDPVRNEKAVSPWWWQQVMFALKNAGRVQEAANLVADAWDGNPEAEKGYRIDQFRVLPTKKAFWDAALHAGVLQRVGLSEADLAKARKMWAGDAHAWEDALEDRARRDERDEEVEEEEETLDDLEERLEEEAATDDD